MDVSDDGSITTSSVSLGTERNSDVKKRKEREGNGEAINENAGPSRKGSEDLPAHLNQWRASTLPRSKLTDFLEVFSYVQNMIIKLDDFYQL